MQLTQIVSITALSLLSALTQSSAQAQPASAFKLFDYPNATSTQAWGINPRGEIVGVYVSADKVTHGFLLSAGRFTSIDYPGAAVTLANGINAQGEIVGEYGLTATAPHHGFLLSEGRFTSFDYPGATASGAIGITPSGIILGYYLLADNLNHGYLLTGGMFTNADYPDATQTIVGGIDPRGNIVGSWVITGGISHGYLSAQSKLTTFDYPGAAFTNALARNGAGEIVGRYRDAAAVSHGYLLSAGQFASFDCPGASFTGNTGITPNGDIVGRCTVAGVSHGFLFQQSRQPRYTITDLGALGGTESIAYGINNAGLVAGGANLANGAQHPFLRATGTMMDLGTLGGSNANATNANGAKLVSLISETVKMDPNSEDFCGWGTHHTCLAAIWKDAKLTPLPTLGGNNAAGFFLNERGQIGGTAEKAVRDLLCTPPQQFRFSPVVFGPSASAIQELTLPQGETVGFALGINDKGEAVGGTGTCDNTSTSAVGLLTSAHAVLWKEGRPTLLGDLGVPVNSTAAAINNRTEVVGSSTVINGDLHSFLWTPDAGMQDIGLLGTDTASFATYINNNNQISGASCDIGFNCRAYLWENGQMTDLNSLVSADAPLYLLFANAINDLGEVVGHAVNKNTGELRAFLATPDGIPQSASLTLKEPFRPTWAAGRESAKRRFGKR